MGILLCEQNFRDVWRRNKSERAEIGKILRTHTHAAKLVVRITKITQDRSQGNSRFTALALPLLATDSHTYFF